MHHRLLLPLLTLLPAIAAAQTAQAESYANGEIRKLDLAAGKVALKHGHIAAIDMPPMTMVFPVEPKTLLDGLKVGDAVRFVVDVRDGRMLVTQIEPASR